MSHIVLFCCYLIVVYVVSLSVEVYAKNCTHLNFKPVKIDRNNKFKLWPGLMSSFDLEHGKTLPGFNEAMEIIWKNQNPPDCSKANYLIGEPFLQGVGSEMHVHGVGLAMAIATGRVFLQYGGWSWRYKNPHCQAQQKNSLECYYMPLSKCSLHDALSTMKTINNDYLQPIPPVMRENMNQTTAPSRRLTATKKSVRPRPLQKATHNTAVNTHSASTPHAHKHPHSPQTHTGTTWTPKEDADLEGAVIKFGVQGQWQRIAQVMRSHNKTDEDCLFRFRNVLRRKLNMRGGPGPKGKANFNDEPSQTDLLADGYGVVSMNKVTEISLDGQKHTIQLRPRHTDKYSDRVMMLAFRVMLDNRKFIPADFQELLSCVKMSSQGYAHWWWRAVTASFFLRPNEATLALLQLHEDPVVKAADGMCVSAYVRHGDKGLEMSLIPFTAYADAAYCMWQQPPMSALPALHNSSSNNSSTIKQTLIASVIDCSEFWANAALNTGAVYNTPQQQRQLTAKPTLFPKTVRKVPGSAALIADRHKTLAAAAGRNSGSQSGLTWPPPKPVPITAPLLQSFNSSIHPKLVYLGSEDPLVFTEARVWAERHNITLRYSNISQILLSDKQGIMKHRDMENIMPTNRQMEYFSYLLHLNDLLKCRAFVCTLASNYCRLVDELRATVGGKANAYFADLTLESCATPPCVRPFSIADYQGEVYDPTKDVLWR